MPKVLSTLDSHTAEIIDARTRTKSARFQPLPEGVERVSDVLHEVGESLAVAFSQDGFRFAKSQLKLSRRVGALSQSVTLQADSANLSGVHVGASAHASVRSADFKRWCEKSGSYVRDILWARQLGYVGGGNYYFKWEFHDPQSVRRRSRTWWQR